MRTSAVRVNYAGAVNHALRRALDERPETILFGEDVALPGGVFGVTRELATEFGERVFDTPISESAILGAAVGAAMVGRRPIVEIMWMDFAMVALDQLVNQAANVRYVSAGRLTAPLTVRTQQGSQPGACAQHSQSLEAMLTHVPGLRVCLPSTPQDAYDLVLAAVWCDDPVVVIESRSLYHGAKVEIQVEGAPPPVGGASIRRSGADVTVVSWGATVDVALAAAELVAAEGIEAEVVDARWLSPFDWTTLFDSLARTRRLVVAHEANVTGGFGAEVLARVTEAGIELDATARRVGLLDTPVPAAPSLLAGLVPDRDRVAEAIRASTTRGSGR